MIYCEPSYCVSADQTVLSFSDSTNPGWWRLHREFFLACTNPSHHSEETALPTVSGETESVQLVPYPCRPLKQSEKLQFQYLRKPTKSSEILLYVRLLCDLVENLFVLLVQCRCRVPYISGSSM